MSRGAEPSEAQLHEAQASQPWIHAAFRPCGTRVAFAATNVAALSAQTVCLLSSSSTQDLNRALVNRKLPARLEVRLLTKVGSPENQEQVAALPRRKRLIFVPFRQAASALPRLPDDARSALPILALACALRGKRRARTPCPSMPHYRAAWARRSIARYARASGGQGYVQHGSTTQPPEIDA